MKIRVRFRAIYLFLATAIVAAWIAHSMYEYRSESAALYDLDSVVTGYILVQPSSRARKGEFSFRPDAYPSCVIVYKRCTLPWSFLGCPTFAQRTVAVQVIEQENPEVFQCLRRFSQLEYLAVQDWGIERDNARSKEYTQRLREFQENHPDVQYDIFVRDNRAD